MGLLDNILNKLGNTAENKLSSEARKAAYNAKQGIADKAKKEIADFKKKKKSFSFDKLPTSVDELKSLPGADLKDPFAVAALTVAAMNHYETDKEATFAMLDFLKGPEKVSEREKQFMRDQLGGKMYVIRSYFEGTGPDNNYRIEAPYKVNVSDNPYSYENAGYAKLFIESSGADSAREILLRKKESTGEWFLWEQFLLSGIRIPKEDNPWA